MWISNAYQVRPLQCSVSKNTGFSGFVFVCRVRKTLETCLLLTKPKIAALLGGDLVGRAFRLARRRDPQSAQRLFRGSIVYLTAVFSLAAALGIWRG